VKKNMPEAVIVSTSRRAHAIELAQEACQKGFRKIIAVGGDGTLHEVVNGVAAFSAKQRPSVGTLFSGTGGDFFRMLREEYKIPQDFDWLKNPKEISIDLGKATLRTEKKSSTEKFFINIADVGISGEVTRRVNSSGKHWGSLEYLKSTLASALFYKAPSVKIYGIQGEKKSKTYEVDLLQLVVANGRYFGGGMCVAPEAQLQDGLFDITVIEKVSYFSMLREFPHFYFKEKIRHPKVHYGHGNIIRVEALKGDLPIGMDGEDFRAKEVTFEVIPRGLKILVPS
jgi:YegS/Rv2252/BmrU family lipid kinase